MKTLYLACCAVAVAFCAEAKDNPAMPVFERLFGDAVKLDPARVAEVCDAKPGERHYYDTNGDGKPDEVWFIDTAKRHPASMRPLLVRVIDEDGDLREGGEPDLDNDLYVADWNADGVVDAVCDYADTDGDGGADEMALYCDGKGGTVPDDAVFCWWGRNMDKDHLLWYDVGYAYFQDSCQTRSHFGGNELFSAFMLRPSDTEWVPLFENPFCFYDLDRDGVTEEVLRICGRGNVIENLRYSFDAAHIATPDDPRHFDVSLSAYAPPNLLLEPRQGERVTLRGVPAQPFLAYDIAPDYARDTQWASMLLTWCENGINIDGANIVDGKFKDTQERWEGIIACGNPRFKQIGGPTCGPFNKRYELAASPKEEMRLYYAPTDQRLHLFGADEMWLSVDLAYVNDPKRPADMRYEYRDTDNDGYIDTWAFDADGDGRPDDTWTAGAAPRQDVPYTWAEVTHVIVPVLAVAPEELFALDARLRQALAKCGQNAEDPVWRLMDSGFESPNLTDDLRRRLLASREGLRFYLDLLKDHLIVALKQQVKDDAFWAQFAAARADGDLQKMQALVGAQFALADKLQPLALWLEGVTAKFARPRVAWAQDWVPPNIGWESETCGYRAYWGQFDMFGKKGKCLIYPGIAKGENYHEEQDWGIDALHVDNTCGLGGTTLYVNGTAYPVYSPSGKGPIVWSKRLVEEKPDSVTVELVAEKAGPQDNPYTVHFLCSALAGKKYSPIKITVDGGSANDRIQLGIGICKLPRENFALDTLSGVMANWGQQEQAIGTVGLGLIFPKAAFVRYVDLPSEHQVVVAVERKKEVEYLIQGNWLNGRQFPRCPNIDNWVEELKVVACGH